MINHNKLKGKIIEHGYNVSRVAEELGISQGTMYRKINVNGSEFTVSEANKLKELLDLSNEEACSIFFPPQSHKTIQNIKYNKNRHGVKNHCL